MWHALRAELAYYRSYLLGGFGLAIGIVGLVSLIFFAVGDDAPPRHVADGIRAMFLIMAPLIVGFVAQALRYEERRDRLLLAGPLTPRDLAVVRVLVSVVLLTIGVLGAAIVLAASASVAGRLEVESVHIAGYVGGLNFAILQMIPLTQEAAAARSQRRPRAAIAGWATFVLAVLVFAALSAAAFIVQGPLTWPSLHLGNLVVALMAMVASVRLYTRRSDFTR